MVAALVHRPFFALTVLSVLWDFVAKHLFFAAECWSSSGWCSVIMTNYTRQSTSCSENKGYKMIRIWSGLTNYPVSTNILCQQMEIRQVYRTSVWNISMFWQAPKQKSLRFLRVSQKWLGLKANYLSQCVIVFLLTLESKSVSHPNASSVYIQKFLLKVIHNLAIRLKVHTS